MQQPSPGRIVMVPIDPVDNNGAPEAPAMITNVFAGGQYVNVRVLLDGPANPPWRTSLMLFESPQAFTDAGSPRHGAWWPPRV